MAPTRLLKPTADIEYRFEEQKNGCIMKSSDKFLTYYCYEKKYTDFGLERLVKLDYTRKSDKLGPNPTFKEIKDLLGNPVPANCQVTRAMYKNQTKKYCVVEEKEKRKTRGKKVLTTIVKKKIEKSCKKCKGYHHMSHVCAAADFSSSIIRHNETYTLINCVPLIHSFNTGVLKSVENRTRDVGNNEDAFAEKHIITTFYNLE